MKKLFTLVLALLLALSLSACGGGGEDAGAQAVVRCGLSSAWDSLMPYNSPSGSNYSRIIYDKIYDRLAYVHADGTLDPRGAESWESADGGYAVLFHLDQGAAFHDGTPVTAEHWADTIALLTDPDCPTLGRAAFSVLAGTDDNGAAVEGETLGAEAVDDYTLVCELEQPLPYFLQYMKFEVMAPIYEPFYTEVGADYYGTSPDTLLYSGAFYMTEWVLENRIVTVKNPYWWNADQVELEKINWIKYTDTNAKYNAFLGGEMDIIDITGEQREAFEAEGYQPSSYVGGYSYYFYCNVEDTERDISNLNLRKAISYAIDRQQFIDTVFKNDNVPSPSFAFGINGVNTETFSEVVIEANGGEPLYPPTANEELAKEYLAKALEELGYTDASQVDITFMVSEGTQNELFHQVIQEQLRRVLGIEAKLEVLTITEARARRNAHDYDLFAGGWGPDYNDPMTDLDLWTTGNGNNHTGYSSEEYDALIEQARTELDPVAREQIFVQAELLLAEDMPIIPTYWRYEDYVVSEKLVEGYNRLPFQGYNLFYTKLAE